MTRDDFPQSVQGRLFEQRVVSIFGRLDANAVSHVAAQLWSLDALGDEPITLLLSVSSSSVGATVALLDVLDVIGVELNATCLGGLSGPAVAVLAGASTRVAAPNARFVLRDEAVELAASYRDLERAVTEHHQQRLQLLGRLADSTEGRRSLGDVIADFERGLSLSAEEAVSYGLVDAVEVGRDRALGLIRPHPPLGFRRPEQN